MTGDCCDHVVSRCTGCVEPAQCVGAGALESECTALRCGAGALKIECTVVQKLWNFCAPRSAPRCVTSPCVPWAPTVSRTDSGSRPSTTSTPGCGSVVTGALGSRPRSYSLPVGLLIGCIVPADMARRDIAGCRRGAGALTTAFGATRATPQCIHLYSAVEALTDQSEYTY